jgi:hypothetical protein
MEGQDLHYGISRYRHIFLKNNPSGNAGASCTVKESHLAASVMNIQRCFHTQIMGRFVVSTKMTVQAISCQVPKIGCRRTLHIQIIQSYFNIRSNKALSDFIL